MDPFVARTTNLLKNPHASCEARVVLQYLYSLYGTGILSGQQESTWLDTPDHEMQYIASLTGKLPAIRGLDYINEDFAGVTQRAKEWWEQGGLVCICWHWGAPPGGVGYESSKGQTDIEAALTPGSTLHAAMLADMDRVAEELKVLQAADVPVLWRPFHEFDGAWFWWGKGGSDKFIRLWRLMYDRYTHHHGLTNLIWVLGYSGEMKDGWYPGDDYVDIAGADTYSEGTQIALYRKVVSVVGSEMPIAYHENGPLPDPTGLIADEARWVWFLTWHTIHIKEQNTPERIQAVYGHPYVVTREQLPDFKALCKGETLA